MNPRARALALRSLSALVLALLGGASACGARPQAATTPPPNAPPPSGPSSNEYPSPRDEERRPDGLSATRREVPVLELRNENSPLVTVRVLFESGSADDPTGKEGLTRLLARAMVEGGTEALTYEQLTRRLFPMAAQLSFHVDRDMVVFTGQVHRDHLAAFYPLLRDVLLHPRLADEDFRRVRAQSVSELTQDLRGADDELLGKELLQALIYANHPYGHPPLGTETGLAALTLGDLRVHRARVFCGDRVVVGLAGAYPTELVAQVRRDLEQLPATCPAHGTLPVPQRPHGVHVVVVDKPSASATAVSLGFPVTITRADADFPAVQFVTNYLGLHRQSSGVLYQTLREARGLNYGDYAYAEHFEQEEGSRFPLTNIQRRQQYASLWLRPMRPANAHFALRGAVRALSRTLEQGIAAEDFDRTRTFLGGYVSLFAQTEMARLGYALDDFYVRAPAGTTYPERMRAAWGQLDREGAVATARRHLTTQDLWVAIVAPNAQQLAEAIGHNAASPITYESPKPPEVLAEDHEIEAYPLAVRPEDVRVVPLASVFH